MGRGHAPRRAPGPKRMQPRELDDSNPQAAPLDPGDAAAAGGVGAQPGPGNGQTPFGAALEPVLLASCGGRLSAVSWFRTDWQRGGALTGYATFKDDDDTDHAVVVKLPVPPRERSWMVRLQDAGDVVPRVFAHGEALGGYDMAWVVMERLPHGPIGSAWGGAGFDLVTDAIGRFYAASADAPAACKQAVQARLVVGDLCGEERRRRAAAPAGAVLAARQIPQRRIECQFPIGRLDRRDRRGQTLKRGFTRLRRCKREFTGELERKHLRRIRRFRRLFAEARLTGDRAFNKAERSERVAAVLAGESCGHDHYADDPGTGNKAGDSVDDDALTRALQNLAG